MRRTLMTALALFGVAGALAGCGEEDPTGVGSGLIGPGVRTFEVVLDAADFLLADTTYDSLGDLQSAGFRIVANDFAGELDAHTLVQIVRPFTVAYQAEEGGPTTTDSLAAIRGARVTLIVDSMAATPAPIGFEVRPVTQSWHRPSVTWELRYDTAGMSAPWTTPGGTTGPVVGTATWESGDTVVIPIDSADAAVWQDTAAARRGALVRTSSPGARVRLRSVRFEWDVVPTGNPDTVLTAGSALQSTFIATPGQPGVRQEELRIGGLPAWRTLLHFRGLADLVVNACTGGLGTGDPACDVPLRDGSLTLASLLLDPEPVGGHRAERPGQIEGRAVLTAENVPVFRAPLSTPQGAMQDTVPVELFTPEAPPGATVGVPITPFVRRLVAPQQEAEDGEEPEPLSRWLALVSTAERGNFGFMGFGSMESTAPPRLRLVVTLPNREIF